MSAPRGRPRTTGRGSPGARKLPVALSAEEYASVATEAGRQGIAPSALAREALLALVDRQRVDR